MLQVSGHYMITPADLALIQQYWWLLVLAALWTIPWKGVALWRAARNGQMKWFVALLVINTLAILEITYIFYFSKKGEADSKISN